MATLDNRTRLAALAHWLQSRMGLDAPPKLEALGRPTGAGFSSETVLFDMWDGEERTSFVLRMPPPANGFPLFPWYDLERQVAVMRLVRERTDVPVPHIPWFEPDEGPLGAPFFVMERVAGRPAPDMPPYSLDGWLHDTSLEARAAMEAGVVSCIAGIHGLSPERCDLGWLEFDEPGGSALRRHVARQRRYYDWIRDDTEYLVIETLFDWLAERWPADEGETVVSWGDSRVANVLFDGQEIVAVLDWEAAALGPRELDLGWLLYFADYFQRIARDSGRPGLPDFLDRKRVLATYATLTGHAPRDIEWYLAYAALRQGLTSIRVSQRFIHRGDAPPPAEPDALVLDRAHIERILDR